MWTKVSFCYSTGSYPPYPWITGGNRVIISPTPILGIFFRIFFGKTINRGRRLDDITASYR